MKNNKQTLAEVIRRQVVKNGSRGTSFSTLLSTAKSVKRTAGKSDVRKTLNRLNAEEVRDGFYTLARY